MWGTQQNFPTALRLCLLVELRIQPARPHGGVGGIPGQHGPSPDPHREPEFPLSEQSRIRTRLLPAAGRELQLQRSQPETDAQLLRRPGTSGQLPLVEEHRPVVQRRARAPAPTRPIRRISAPSAAHPISMRPTRSPSRRNTNFPGTRIATAWRRALLGGFQISPILTYHTGFPYTVKIGQSVSTPGGPTLGPIRPTRYFGNAVYDNSNDAFLNGSNWPGGGAQYFNIRHPARRESDATASADRAISRPTSASANSSSFAAPAPRRSAP